MTRMKESSSSEKTRMARDAALQGLSIDMHEVSTRSCSTCAAVTEAFGFLFGCDQYRRETARRKKSGILHERDSHL